MVGNVFHVFGAAIANFNVISVENILKCMIFGKYLSKRLRKWWPIFADTVLINGRLNQILFLFAIYFVCVLFYRFILQLDIIS